MEELEILKLHDDILPKFRGNISATAKFLGMNRGTLYTYMRRKNSVYVIDGVVYCRKGKTIES